MELQFRITIIFNSYSLDFILALGLYYCILFEELPIMTWTPCSSAQLWLFWTLRGGGGDLPAGARSGPTQRLTLAGASLNVFLVEQSLIQRTQAEGTAPMN